MIRDRRRFLRVEVALRATCSPILDDGSRGDPFPAETVNVSAGGALLRADRPFIPGRKLWLELAFERPRFLLFCEASVLRLGMDAREAAIAFTAVDEYVEQRIVRWVYAEDRRIFDRRSGVRIRVRLRVVCRRESGETIAAPSLDMTGDGLRILSDSPLALGERVEVEIHFDDGVPSPTLAATVIWQGDEGDRRAYGLEYEGLNLPTARSVLERALAAEARQRQ